MVLSRVCYCNPCTQALLIWTPKLAIENDNVSQIVLYTISCSPRSMLKISMYLLVSKLTRPYPCHLPILGWTRACEHMGSCHVALTRACVTKHMPPTKCCYQPPFHYTRHVQRSGYSTAQDLPEIRFIKFTLANTNPHIHIVITTAAK